MLRNGSFRKEIYIPVDITFLINKNCKHGIVYSQYPQEVTHTTVQEKCNVDTHATGVYNRVVCGVCNILKWFLQSTTKR